ncbi:MAG: carbohydrate kinase, partial [Candidatus Marinimicrobia bacterium]|nr:carbohydrate kinase [Candidatus Neomarinimicrobiota bacterium]
AAAAAAWHAALARVAGTVTGAVIEDYGKGAVTQAAVDQLLATCRAARVPVGYDPKEDHALEVAGIALATPNRREACLAAGLQEPALLPPPLEDKVLLAAARKLLEIWQPELLAVTLGPDGMLLFDRAGRRDLIPTVAREVFDVSGAGDTVIATALLARVAGAAPVEAALLANLAAGVVVGKVGTATCSMAELRAALADWTPS